MELDDIPEPPEWLVESWPLARPFWHKNDLGARLDAWAKCDPLLLNESNPLQDSEVSNYWKRHDPMEQYSSNPRNVRRKKRIRTPPAQAEPSAPHTPLTIRSKHSISTGEDSNLIPQQLQSELLNAQKTCHISNASASNPSVSFGLPTRRKRTLTVLGQALEKEKLLKQARLMHVQPKVGKAVKVSNCLE